MTDNEHLAMAGCICDECEYGREHGCPHAQGRHYDAWGEGLSNPDWCPQRADDKLPF